MDQIKTGRFISQERKSRNLTQKQLGETVGVSQRTYAYYESGQRMLTPQVLCSLAKFYNTSVDYLLELTDDPRPYPRRR